MNSKKDSAGMFKKLVQARTQETAPKPVPQPAPTDSETPIDSETEAEIQLQPKKKGRPATGKRSDPNWIGRTYYIRRTTDLNVEEELLALKRRGINLDKSDLVDGLLGAWVKWRQGENAESQLGEISPRRNDGN